MAIKIKLTERQQKLAAGEIDGDEQVDNAEALKDAGFDFIDSDDDGASESDDDDLQPSGEYIDDGLSGDSSDSQSGNGKGNTLPDWVDDRVRTYAASYGLTDEDLGTFSGFDALQRFGTLVDRRYADSVRADSAGQAADGQEGDAADAGGSSKGGEGQQSSEKKSSLLERLKPLDRKRYEEAKYGEAELDLVDQLNGAIEAIRQIAPGFLQQQEQALAQQQEKMLAEFHQTLDEIDSSVYGRAYKDGKPAGKLSEAFDSNRRAVMDTMERLSKGIVADAERRGVQPQIPPVSVLAQRASAIVLGTLPTSSQQGGGRASVDQIAAQSRRRRPAGAGGVRRTGTVGSSYSRGSSQSAVDEVKELARNPAIASFFKKAQRENGVD